MEKITATVSWKASHGKGIKVDGRDNWFNGTEQQLVSVEKGKSITFEHESGKIIGAVEVGAAAAPAAKSTGGGRAYKDHQKTIAFQAARNSALALLGHVISTEGVKWPAAQDKKLLALTAFVDEYTERYFKQAVEIDNDKDVTDVLFGGE